MEALETRLEHGSPPVMYLSGEIDIATADKLRAALDAALSTDADLVVDMTDVAFIDGTGLRAILRVAESLNGNGPLALVHAPQVVRLLELTGLTGIPSIRIAD
jgi:anti-anti-sigma factor